MTKVEYLNIAGYDPKIWEVVSKEAAMNFLAEPGAVNNMYSITDRKAVDSFGSGCYVVKTVWLRQTMDTMDSEGRGGGVKAPEPLKPETKQVPPPPKAVPPPPPVPAPPSDIEDAEYEEVEDVEDDEIFPEPPSDFLCEKYDNTTIACDEQCDSCRDIENAKEVVEEDLTETQEHTPKQLERIKIMNDLGWNQEGDIFRRSGISVTTKFVFDSEDSVFDLSISNMKKTDAEHKAKMDAINKEKTEKVDPVAKAQEDLKKIVEASGVPADKVIIGSISGTVISTGKASEGTLSVVKDDEITAIEEGLDHKGEPEIPLNADGSVNTTGMDEADARDAILEHQKDSKKGKLTGTLTAKKSTPEEIEESKKAADKPKEVKKKAEPIVVISADELTAKRFAVVDELMEILILFKRTSYAMVQIKDILDLDITPQKKIDQIRDRINIQ